MKKIFSLLLLFTMIIAVTVGCSSKETSKESSKESASNVDKNGVKTFTAFMAVPGTEVPSDNRMMNKIAEKIGAKANVTWLTGQTAKERIGVMISGGEYPDFVDASDGTAAMIKAGAFIPLDKYLDDYPNLKNYWSESEWNQVRSADGHIYIIPQFGKRNIKDTAVKHNDEAFWIQKRVLKWANYPKIKTLDEYFDLVQRYLKANPTSNDGQKNIGFEILSDDWRYFALENPPQFLVGYPNDGAAIVDSKTLKAHVYDTTPEAKEYFKILSQQYAAGVIDPETFTASYDQYIAKLSSGRVVGMIDQGWDFQTANDSLVAAGMDDRTYVPLDLVLDSNTKPMYYTPPALNPSNGIGITVSCKDVKGALKFLNDLLDPDVVTMRSWGEKGVDYEVDKDGLLYRTDKERANAKDPDWVAKNLVSSGYSYFPIYGGMMMDGKNTVVANEQPSEYYATLSDIDKEVLDAYGYKKWTDFLTFTPKNSPWYPIYSATNTWTADTSEGIAKQKMSDVKHQWLPKVIMTSPSKFDKTWDTYMKTYKTQVDYKAYENALTKEVKRRVDVANGKSAK